MSEILKPDAYMDRHKRAFRVAFDYLNAHFPPRGEEYWVNALADLKDAHDRNQDPLTDELLKGIYAYLETEYKVRRETHADDQGTGVS